MDGNVMVYRKWVEIRHSIGNRESYGLEMGGKVMFNWTWKLYGLEIGGNVIWCL